MPHPDTKYEGTVLGTVLVLAALAVLFIGVFEPSFQRVFKFLGLLVAVALAFFAAAIVIGSARLRRDSEEGE